MELTKEQKLAFWSKVNIRGIDECWIWQGWRNGSGYGQIEIGGKRLMSHKIAFFLTFGYMPELLLLHKCDNPPCVNPNHMKEGTHIENMRDMRYKGRGTKKLNVEQIAAIRSASGTQREIASRFGVAPSTVHKIRARITWKNVVS